MRLWKYRRQLVATVIGVAFLFLGHGPIRARIADNLGNVLMPIVLLWALESSTTGTLLPRRVRVAFAIIGSVFIIYGFLMLFHPTGGLLGSLMIPAFLLGGMVIDRAITGRKASGFLDPSPEEAKMP